MRKKIRYAYLGILAIAVALCLWNICAQHKIHPQLAGRSLEGAGDNVGPMEETGEIAQTFTEDHDFCGLAFLAGNYERPCVGVLHLKLYDEITGEEILSKDYSAKEIKNNQMSPLLFDEPVSVSGERQFRVVLSADMKLFFSHATIWKTEGDDYPDGALYIKDAMQESDLVFDTIYGYENVNLLGMKARRCSLVLLLGLFLALHAILDVRAMYAWMFQKRLWIAIGFFAFLVLGKYHFSSVGQFDGIIEPGEGSQYCEPVFGTSQNIRGDEWNVSLPRMLSASYSHYGKYNEIVRATKTTNLSASGLYLHYSALAEPSQWGFYLFGPEYGLSYMWCFRMVFGFFFSFEFCLLLSRGKRLLSLLGAALIWFSAYNMWWSITTWLLSGQAAIVCLAYFLDAEKKWKRLLLGAATAIFASFFLVTLYPAWQVPAGYLYLCVLIWLLIEKREKLRAFHWQDWGIAILSVIFMLSIVGDYLWNYQEYMHDIMNTVYPGNRVSYGGFALGDLFGGLLSFLAPYRYAGILNQSEMGCFLSLFPIPYFMGIRMLIKNARQKRKDVLLWLLMALSTLFALYCMVPLPKILAKCLLLTYSTPFRLADVLGYCMVLSLIYLLGNYGAEARFRPLPGILLLAAVFALMIAYPLVAYQADIGWIWYLSAGVALFVLFLPMVADLRSLLRGGQAWMAGYAKYAAIALAVAVMGNGLAVNPLMCGLDVIYSKPLAKEVRSITKEEPKAKWIAVGSNPNYLLACGAPTINSVNYVPNLPMWELLDPEGKKEKVYKRYAHLEIALTKGETKIKLRAMDQIRLKLSMRDLQKMSVSYIYAGHSLKGADGVDFEEIYHNGGSYIYRVCYP